MSEAVIEDNSMVHLRFEATWNGIGGKHTAVHEFEKFNVWRDLDLLPQPFRSGFVGQKAGESISKVFQAGELVETWQDSRVTRIADHQFTGQLMGQPIKPRLGRFYPASMIAGLRTGVGMQPVRYIEKLQEGMLVDCNHPLAGKVIELKASVVEVHGPAKENGGRCNEVIQELLTGPGMQDAYHEVPTDFFTGETFVRLDESDDAEFYRTERKVHHLDARARGVAADIYGQLLPGKGSVLDLMASWESHLPANRDNLELVGLGMNEAELKANTRLSDFSVHDLNGSPVMPYEDDAFDAVICTASIEYLIYPEQVFRDIRRVLKAGGLFVVVFSNRWFQTKAISAWSEMHEFERVGMIAEYFRRSGWDGNICSLSHRGLRRPADDRHISRTSVSDPVYAVWGNK